MADLVKRRQVEYSDRCGDSAVLFLLRLIQVVEWKITSWEMYRDRYEDLRYLDVMKPLIEQFLCPPELGEEER